VVAAKIVVYTLAGALFGMLSAALSLALTSIWLNAAGSSMPWSNDELWRTIAGAIAWNAAFAAIGVGIGALVRNLALATAGALAWLALVEGVVGQLLGRDLTQWLPFSAGTALGRIPASIADGLPQWGAAALLLGYALAFAGLAIATSTRRDVV
jgi:ABC-2 type transport system permease protein